MRKKPLFLALVLEDEENAWPHRDRFFSENRAQVISQFSLGVVDVIGNKVLGSSSQATLAILDAQIVQTRRQFYETI